jgi:ribosomal protein S26
MNVNCRGCGKEIPEDKALYRGSPAKNHDELAGRDWKDFAKCEDCDYQDYSNTYGGM